MAEHSRCQPGRPVTLMPAGDGQAGSPRMGLPQHEIHRIALIGRDLDASAGAHLVERAPRELAVIRHRRDMEKDMVLGDIGEVLGDGVSTIAFICSIYRSRAAPHPAAGSRARPRPCGTARPSLRSACGCLFEGQVRIKLGRPRIDLVFHVGDVAHIGDLAFAV